MGNTSERPVAIVTGAARGIGLSCAKALAQAGFHLILNDIQFNNGDAVSDSIAIAADVSDLATHDRLIQSAIDQWGRLDCLVNNAGVSVMSRGDLLDVSPESFDRCLGVNTRAVFFLSQAVARRMILQGEVEARHRSIINITSSNAVAASIDRGEYCVSKSASSMITKLFGLRLAEAGIGVYEIRPGLIETEMTRPSKARYDARIHSPENPLVPARRWGQPEEVAQVVRLMAEGRLPYSVGQAIAVDGGMTVLHY